MKTLETKKAPAAIGPYSQAKMVGNFVFASGQIPVDPATGDMADFAAFNAVYEKYFTSKPARSCVAVKQLPKNVLCEVEAIAVAE